MKYDDEDSFIDDSDFDEDKSFGESESESEEENMPKLSDGEESVGEGPSGDRRSKRLRKRNRYNKSSKLLFSLLHISASYLILNLKFVW